MDLGWRKVERYRFSAEEQELLRKRAWMFRQIDKARGRKPYRRLPLDHPLFDAEDLPQWWLRWIVEGIGFVLYASVIGGAMWLQLKLTGQLG